MWRKEIAFGGRLVMLGFGCVGQGMLPLLLRHVDMPRERIVLIDPQPDVAQEPGIRYVQLALTRANYRDVLLKHLGAGDFLLNMSVDVSSTALMALCRDIGALYLDASTEPWAGGYVDAALPPAARTNHVLREAALALRRPGTPTAVITHGANPGLVTYFVKQALLDIARDTGAPTDAPATRDGWARLAQRLGVRVIHVAERDTQTSGHRKQPGEFVNTWSVDGFIGESLQPAELGWGTHERHFPADGGRHETPNAPGIFLHRPGAATRVRTWTPLAGPFHGFLVTHAEALSIADHLTVHEGGSGPVAGAGAGAGLQRAGGERGRAAYRPTVHYAYHPCDDAVLSLVELAGREWRPQERKRVLRDEITSGRDELGVLLMGHAKGAYWYGSQLTIDQTRALAERNSATTLQVTAAVLAGVIWALRNPRRGVVEPEDLPFDEMLALSRPYLGDVVGAYTDWTPLAGRGRLYDEPIDRDDPWQFGNFRVS